MSIPLSILNIGSTYYMKDLDEKPVFIMEGIRQHAILNLDIKFWETCILHKNLNMGSINENSKMKQNQFQESISQNIMSIAFHMNDIFKDKRIIKDVCNKYIQVYKLGDKASGITSYLTRIEKETTK